MKRKSNDIQLDSNMGSVPNELLRLDISLLVEGSSCNIVYNWTAKRLSNNLRGQLPPAETWKM